MSKDRSTSHFDRSESQRSMTQESVLESITKIANNHNCEVTDEPLMRPDGSMYVYLKKFPSVVVLSIDYQFTSAFFKLKVMRFPNEIIRDNIISNFNPSHIELMFSWLDMLLEKLAAEQEAINDPAFKKRKRITEERCVTENKRLKNDITELRRTNEDLRAEIRRLDTTCMFHKLLAETAMDSLSGSSGRTNDTTLYENEAVSASSSLDITTDDISATNDYLNLSDDEFASSIEATLVV